MRWLFFKSAGLMVFTSLVKCKVMENLLYSFPLFVFLPLVYQQEVSQSNEVVEAGEESP